MACTKYTLEQYQTLNNAISQGAMEVTYGDKKVKYQSLDDMLRLQLLMERCLFPQKNSNNGRTLASFNNGTRPRRKRC